MRRLVGLADFFDGDLEMFVGGAKRGLYMLIESGNMNRSAQNLKKALASMEISGKGTSIADIQDLVDLD